MFLKGVFFTLSRLLGDSLSSMGDLEATAARSTPIISSKDFVSRMRLILSRTLVGKWDAAVAWGRLM
jgi:hypothetical protein